MKSPLLLLFAFICINSFSQTDTIVTRKGKAIICTITLVNPLKIYFKNRMDDMDDIEIYKIYYIVQNGKKKYADEINSENFSGIINTKSTHDSVLVSNELKYMKNCFRKCHNEYVVGASTVLCGVLISLSGAYMTSSGKGDSTFIISFGGAITMAGGIVMFDSHKWIGRAGIGITGNGISVKYIFK